MPKDKQGINYIECPSCHLKIKGYSQDEVDKECIIQANFDWKLAKEWHKNVLKQLRKELIKDFKLYFESDDMPKRAKDSGTIINNAIILTVQYFKDKLKRR